MKIGATPCDILIHRYKFGKSGFQYDGMTKNYPNGWNMPGRPRKKPTKYPNGPKLRWSKILG
jgi:hypothetical protein